MVISWAFPSTSLIAAGCRVACMHLRCMTKAMQQSSPRMQRAATCGWPWTGPGRRALVVRFQGRRRPRGHLNHLPPRKNMRRVSSMETHDLRYSPDAALEDAAAMRAHSARLTSMNIPWWQIALLSAVWPLLGLTFVFEGLTFIIPLFLIAVGSTVAITSVTRAEKRGVGLGVVTGFKKAPLEYIALGVIALMTPAMMPLTDAYGWPSWYGLIGGIVAGVLTFALSMWVSHRTADELEELATPIQDEA